MTDHPTSEFPPPQDHALLEGLRDRNAAEKRVEAGLALADKLDAISEMCASRATVSRSEAMEIDLLCRASTYQECAGLIREAFK